MRNVKYNDLIIINNEYNIYNLYVYLRLLK